MQDDIFLDKMVDNFIKQMEQEANKKLNGEKENC